MKKKAKEELDARDEKCRSKEKSGGSQGPKSTMSVLMQSRASFSDGKAVGIDGISADVFKSIPWRALQKIYLVQNKEEIEAWLRNIIVLIPKKRTMNRFGWQTRGICVQSVVAKWYCGCLSILLEIELREVCKRDKSWENIHTIGLEEGHQCI